MFRLQTGRSKHAREIWYCNCRQDRVVLKQMDAIHLFGHVVGSLLSNPSTDSTKESTDQSGDTDPSLEESSAGSSDSSVPAVEELGKSPDDSSKLGAGSSQ
jgi:hypothetical protein